MMRVFLFGILLCGVLWTPRAWAKRPGNIWKQRISVNLHKVDIHDFLRLFSEASGYNIVVSRKVKGRVTMRLRNVTWAQALKWVLRSLGLVAVLEGNVVRVVILRGKRVLQGKWSLQGDSMSKVPRPLRETLKIW